MDMASSSSQILSVWLVYLLRLPPLSDIENDKIRSFQLAWRLLDYFLFMVGGPPSIALSTLPMHVLSPQRKQLNTYGFDVDV